MTNGQASTVKGFPGSSGLYKDARKLNKAFFDQVKRFQKFQQEEASRIALYNKVVNLHEATQQDDWKGPSTHAIETAIQNGQQAFLYPNETTAAWKATKKYPNVPEDLKAEVDWAAEHPDYDLVENALYKNQELAEKALKLNVSDSRGEFEWTKHLINDYRAEVNRAAQDKIDFIESPSQHGMDYYFEYDFDNVTDFEQYEAMLLSFYEAVYDLGLTKRGREFLAEQFRSVVEDGQTDVFNPFSVVNPPLTLNDDAGGILSNATFAVQLTLPEVYSQLQIGLATAMQDWKERQDEQGVDTRSHAEKALVNWRVRWFRIVVGSSDLYLDDGNTTDSHVKQSIDYGDLNDPQKTGMVDVSGLNDWSDVEKGTKKLVSTSKRNGKVVSMGTMDTLVGHGVSLWTAKKSDFGNRVASSVGWVTSVIAVADGVYNEWTNQQSMQMNAKTVHSGMSNLITLMGNKDVHVLRKVVQSSDVTVTEYAKLSWANTEAATELGEELVSSNRALAYDLMGKAGCVLDCFSIYWDISDGLSELEQGDTSVAIGKFVGAAAAGVGTGLTIYGMVTAALAVGAEGSVLGAALAASGPGGWIVAGVLVLVGVLTWVICTYTDDTQIETYLKNTAFGTNWTDDNRNRTNPEQVDFRFNTVTRLKPNEEQDVQNVPQYEQHKTENWARQASENLALQFQIDPYEEVGTNYATTFKVSRTMWASGEVLLLFPLKPSSTRGFDVSNDPGSNYYYYENQIRDWVWALRFDDLKKSDGTEMSGFADVSNTPQELGFSDSNPGGAITCQGKNYWATDSEGEYTQRYYEFSVQTSAEYELFGISNPSHGPKMMEAMVVHEDFIREAKRIADEKKYAGFADLSIGNFSTVKRDRATITKKE